MLDNAPAEVGIDQVPFGAGDSLLEYKVIDPLLPGDTREILGFENLHSRAFIAGYQSPGGTMQDIEGRLADLLTLP